MLWFSTSFDLRSCSTVAPFTYTQIVR